MVYLFSIASAVAVFAYIISFASKKNNLNKPHSPILWIRKYQVVIISAIAVLFIANLLVEKKSMVAAEVLELTNSDRVVKMFVPQFPCSEVYETPGLEGIIGKIVVGNFPESTKLLEKNLMEELASTQDKMSENMKACYGVIGSRLKTIFKAYHPESPLTGIASLNGKLEAVDSFASKLNEVERQLVDLKSAVDSFEQAKKEVRLLEGYIVGEHDQGLYEIRYNYGQTALLLTKNANYTSRGIFALYVKDKGEIDATKTRDAGGFEVKVRVFEEESEFLERYRQAEASKKLILELEPKIKEQRSSFESAERDFRARVALVAEGKAVVSTPSRETASQH